MMMADRAATRNTASAGHTSPCDRVDDGRQEDHRSRWTMESPEGASPAATSAATALAPTHVADPVVAAAVAFLACSGASSPRSFEFHGTAGGCPAPAGLDRPAHRNPAAGPGTGEHRQVSGDLVDGRHEGFPGQALPRRAGVPPAR